MPPQPSPAQGPLLSLHSPRPTSSVIVAEKSMVWRWWEHMRMISFICSSKYSSSILANRGGERSTKWAGPASVSTKHRKHTGDVCVSSLATFQAHVFPYFMSVTLSFYQYSPRITIWPHLSNLFSFAESFAFQWQVSQHLTPKYFSTCSLRTRILSYTDTMSLSPLRNSGNRGCWLNPHQKHWHFIGVTP